MKFLDSAKIFVQSGAGGPGAVSFRREKFVEFGGPDGGKGGRGGHVVMRTVASLNTLIDFRYRQHFKAKRGKGGGGGNRSGLAAEDIVILVPVGTQVFMEDGQTLLCDLDQEDQEITIAHGGDGGRGNQAFKSSTNRAPRRHEPGFPGEEFWLWLRLKLLADCGLVGLPNAGKSTFLNAVTMATSKVGDYPFTTLYPQLGVINAAEKPLVVADIPGLIAGASDGVGLGTRFLGHVERCQTLIHMIDVTSDQIAEAYDTIIHELSVYEGNLHEKPSLVVLNKCDVCDDETLKQAKKFIATKHDGPIFCISALQKTGLAELIDHMLAHHTPAQADEIAQPWHP
ncbi:MAG: GTPase ObgE [Pseudomonadota bacterium]